MFILEADPTGSTVIYSIEIFDRRDDGIRGIMGIYLNAHRNTSADFGVLIEKQLKGDVLGCWAFERQVSTYSSRVCQTWLLNQAREPFMLNRLHIKVFQIEEYSTAIPKTASTHCLCAVEGGNVIHGKTQRKGRCRGKNPSNLPQLLYSKDQAGGWTTPGS
jgi:hypothetical protein